MRFVMEVARKKTRQQDRGNASSLGEPLFPTNIDENSKSLPKRHFCVLGYTTQLNELQFEPAGPDRGARLVYR